MNTNVNGIVFAQAQDNKKAVVANRYVAHALYTQNKAIAESLGGVIIKGVNGFRAEFKTAANAKKFVNQAITEMSAEEYNSARKQGGKKSKASEKGNKAPTKSKTKTAAKGNEAPSASTKVKETKELKAVAKEASTHAEVNETPTDGNKNPNRRDRLLEKMKVSALNRAAAKCDRANGGNGLVTFATYGKSAQELKAYMPAAIEDTLKAKKFHDKAIKFGITKEMLSK